jgi:hypothetical protein
MEQGARQSPVAPSPPPLRPAPGTKEAKKTRPVRYPVQLRVNINEQMAASLQRVCRRWGVPEGIGARIAITQFLAQQDPQYRGE